MRRALAINEHNLGAEHSEVARNLNNLALFLHATDRSDEAEQLLRRAVKIGFKLPRVGGHAPASLKNYIRNFSELLRAMGRSETEITEQLRTMEAKSSSG